MKIAAFYARVSDDRRQNLEVQLGELRQHFQTKGSDPSQEYSDDVSSRRPMKDRPGLVQLLEDCQRNRVDRVYVVALDRLARDLRELLWLSDFFNGLHVDLISLKEAIDTTTPVGRLYFHIVAAFAQFERERIRERIMAGLAHARHMGVRLGNTKFLNLDEDLVMELHGNGWSRGAIARRLSTPGRQVYPMQVTRVLRRNGAVQAPVSTALPP